MYYFNVRDFFLTDHSLKFKLLNKLSVNEICSRTSVNMSYIVVWMLLNSMELLTPVHGLNWTYIYAPRHRKFTEAELDFFT